ncbi:MAG: sensor histidine kinase [Acidimicrobiia bacterium]|nr:sensor histidine kinase [Acidimicrobiia bacterium]
MTTPIEPGLLNLFRWYVGVWTGLLVLVFMGERGDGARSTVQAPEVGLVLFGALFVFLVVPWFRRVTGRAFLPIALVVATVAPIASAVHTITVRLELGYSPNEALSDYWIPFFLLFVPFILVVWQYRYRWVLVFALGSPALDLVATGGALTTHVDQFTAPLDLEVLAALVVARGALFAFVGFFIAKLVARQRDLRRELRVHALTVEQVSTARERTRLARELHDTLAHTMSGIAVQLEAAMGVWEIDRTKAHDLVDQALTSSRTGLTDARRAIEDLRASPLDEHGLIGALRILATNSGATSGITIDFEGAEPFGPIAPDVEHAIYRIMEEALHNAVRHAGAANVGMTLDIGAEAIVGTVDDDGTGFDPAAVPDGRHGIEGMSERARLVGGRMSIGRREPHGTRVEFWLPHGEAVLGRASRDEEVEGLQ